MRGNETVGKQKENGEVMRKIPEDGEIRILWTDSMHQKAKGNV